MSTITQPAATHAAGPDSAIRPRGLVRRFVFSRLAAFERATGTSADYARWMANVSLRAFFKFAKLGTLARYRRVLSPEVSSVAHIVAARDADCGSCVQIAVNFALRDGVSRDVLRAVLDRRPDQLPPNLADVYRLAESVCTGVDDEGLRERVRAQVGDEGLIELGLGMAVGRTFPIVKRTLGYAQSCSIVKIQV